MIKWLALLLLLPLQLPAQTNDPSSWIRINQLGYTPGGVKVAVWCSKQQQEVKTWQLIDANTQKIVYSGKTGKALGAYGPFLATCRIDFSSFNKSGMYYLRMDKTPSPVFMIGDDVYKGAADFCLRYMRQQRCGYNPYLKDSCHTHDGYVLYGKAAGIADSSYVDVTGGWHDASDYLQYATTSANAAWHLLMAYHDFPAVFGDEKNSNGLDGRNGLADVLDEAKWGIDWLMKMHPQEDRLFNQVADDRDHRGMRIPGEDSFYGKAYERPVYFVSGEPQQRGKFMNATTGTSSSAAKFSTVFSLGYEVFLKKDTQYAGRIWPKALSAMNYAYEKKGVTQTASVRSPYIYAEDNWTDDMELQHASYASALKQLKGDAWQYIDAAFDDATAEKITPWLGKDTANHYQWYPFVNAGHRELARLLTDKTILAKNTAKYTRMRTQLIAWYKEGIQRVSNKAGGNAFLRGVPFIWCSNNLTVSFAIQCYWYKELTGDHSFDELEQANFDWLFGCNPWGTGMVYGLPATGDTPVDPHSAFTHLKKYPIDGGLVDGPVYGSIYKNLIGITLNEPDEYAALQSDLVVYHDDYGDYSTNEPTMDGTAALIYLLAAKEAMAQKATAKKATPAATIHSAGMPNNITVSHGGIIRGDTAEKKISLVFTGDEFAEGGDLIFQTLQEQKIKASFFFTGNFYRNDKFKTLVQQLKQQGNYLGAHSDRHLLYCDWTKRDSLLVSKEQFQQDLSQNYTAMAKAGIKKQDAPFFLPAYEWYNDTIAAWTKDWGAQLINFTPGTRSNADYTWPELKSYQDNNTIYNSITNYERSAASGLNGFLLLVHIGTDPRRTDKFYRELPRLIAELKAKGYHFQTVKELLSPAGLPR